MAASLIFAHVPLGLPLIPSRSNATKKTRTEDGRGAHCQQLKAVYEKQQIRSTYKRGDSPQVVVSWGVTFWAGPDATVGFAQIARRV